MEDLQLSTLHVLVFFFSKTRKSMNMSISASKKEHLFSRIKGCFFIINVAQTKTLVCSFLVDVIGWFKNNRQIYLQYIVLYIYICIIYIYSYTYGYMWLYGYIWYNIYIIYLVIFICKFICICICIYT